MENKDSNVQTIPQNKMTPAQWLLRLLQGAIIGAGAVLPGISGGVLCVVFGIYQPMMELLAHPFKMFKKYYMMFIPILLGVAAGFFLLAKLLSLLFNANETIMVCIFIGLSTVNPARKAILNPHGLLLFWPLSRSMPCLCSLSWAENWI